MTTKTDTKPKPKGHHKHEEKTEALKKRWVPEGGKLLGQLVTWKPEGGPFKHSNVVEALKGAGLDDKEARLILPEQAFRRATTKMKDDGVIDHVKDDGERIKFQLTKKAMEAGEVVYEKDTFIYLDKVEGKVSCERKQLQDKVQLLVDAAIEDRTTGDITRIFNNLFTKNADLVPFKGGVYIVPQEHVLFVEKVETFISALGCHIMRFPIPAGSSFGDKTFQECMVSYLADLVKDHEDAIEAFTVTTRGDTVERMAERIKETRFKVESYATYLDTKKSDLLKTLSEKEEKLVAKVKALAEERKLMPPKPGSARAHACLFGHSISLIIRWCARNGWSWKQSRRTMDNLGFGEVADKTIETQQYYGRKKKADEYPIPELTDEQVKTLEDARDKKEES